MTPPPHSYSCAPRRVDLRLVTEQWAGSTTRSFPGPALGEVIGGADAALGYSAACPQDWLHLDVTATVRHWTSGAWANHGLEVTASETDSYGWKKFNANQGLRSPHIALGYTDNRPPDAPRMLAPADHATLPATPTLQAVYPTRTATPAGSTFGCPTPPAATSPPRPATPGRTPGSDSLIWPHLGPE